MFGVLQVGASCTAVSAAAALCNLAGVQIKTNVSQRDTSVLMVKERKNPRNSEKFTGEAQTLRCLCRMHDSVALTTKLYGMGAVQNTQVDYFLDLAFGAMKGPVAEICGELNKHLASRTYLVGQVLTAADLAVWQSLHEAKSEWPGSLQSSLPYLARWFAFLSASEPTLAKKIVTPERKKNKGGSFIALAGDTSNVVTRFPPEPSGYLHIGHCKAALLNNYFAEHYNGRLILRFDDTNPEKEKDEYVQNIIKDLATLKVNYHVITHTSDHFDTILAKARDMLTMGKAYIDDTPVDQMRQERFDGIESKNRNNTLEKNRAMFEEMIQGSELGKTYCMRGKIDMTNNNKCLRDPVFYRCNDTPHHRTGTTHKVYPTYDFACPIVDSIEGVTHTLRTTEYNQRDPQYYWVIDALGIRKPIIWAYSRLNFVQTLLSKRKLNWFVQAGLVEGWHDPRFPTVQGIMRRGMQVEALKEFILSQGASRSDNLMQWDKIWNVNKKHIDPVAPRYNAISCNRVEVKITNFPENTKTDTTVPLHPKNASLGRTPFVMTSSIVMEQSDANLVELNEEVTLMNWGNAIITKIDTTDGVVTGLEAKLHLEGNVQETKKKLTWLPVTEDAESAPVDVVFVTFDYLITVDKLLEGQDFKDFLTENSRTETKGTGDHAMGSLKVDDIIQVQRRGYFRVDSVGPITLFSIPTGKTRGMSVMNS